MTDHETERPTLDLGKGSINYLSTSARYRRHEGWELQVWHGHDGEDTVCKRVDRYERLGTDEMLAVLDWWNYAVNDAWRSVDGVCVPLGRNPFQLGAR